MGSKCRAFSLIEIMVVLMISSFVFMIIYELISIGISFFESFSRGSDFSVMQFLRDLEYEINNGEDFSVYNRVLEIRGKKGIVRYIFGTHSKDFSYFQIRKEFVSNSNKGRKDFLLRGVLEVEIREEVSRLRKKVFLSVVNVRGHREFEGYLP
ncbi:MAG: prepilin-type N-terminal cleavage/methylation domain-containing protein [Brevinematia bacterium]